MFYLIFIITIGNYNNTQVLNNEEINQTKNLDNTEDFVKVRCSLNGEDKIFTFKGSVFNYMPQQKPELLFKVLGFNIAKCIKDENNNWILLTRELMYYLDPITNEKLSIWNNPYTNEKVNVVHVSNDPVNNYMGPIPIEKISPEMGLILIDVPLFYPNPLSEDQKFFDYSGKDKFYEAGEFFKFYFNINELSKSKNSLENVQIAWNRDSPYLPWMKMKDIDGRLVISAYGAKSDNFESFPSWLKMDLKFRVNKYLNAPSEYQTPNETSLSYFKKHFEEYLNWEQFPLEDKKIKKSIEKSKNIQFLE